MSALLTLENILLPATARFVSLLPKGLCRTHHTRMAGDSQFGRIVAEMRKKWGVRRLVRLPPMEIGHPRNTIAVVVKVDYQWILPEKSLRCDPNLRYGARADAHCHQLGL